MVDQGGLRVRLGLIGSRARRPDWYLIRNHTRQHSGALGVPMPSTSDVRSVRWLAETRGLERARVTNGFYTFDVAIDELREFRWR